MVTLNEELTIASPADAIWPLLRDPAVMAGCIPGAQFSADGEDGVWRGSIRIKFGPTVAQFRGEATLAFDDAARRVTIDGRGIDGRGASRALASSVVELHGDDTTTMKVTGEFTVTGPLEPFVNAGGVHVARALLGEFCTNIAAAVAAAESGQADADGKTSEQPSAATTPAVSEPEASPLPDSAGAAAAAADTPPPRPPQPPSQVANLNAGSLLWQALLSWLNNLLGKGNRPHE
jgi:carbon monoxide dehydrogenase subunit G